MQINLFDYFRHLFNLSIARQRQLDARRKHKIGRGQRNIVVIHRRLDESRTYVRYRRPVDMTPLPSRQFRKGHWSH